MGTFTMNISPKEKSVLEALAEEKGMTQAGIMLQALRLYQIIEKRMKLGEKIFTENDKAARTELEFIL